MGAGYALVAVVKTFLPRSFRQGLEDKVIKIMLKRGT